MKKILSVIGIRPDAIRMSEIFKKLDKQFGKNHILVHTGQHYDYNLSDTFFNDLKLREPDYKFNAGKKSSDYCDFIYHASKEMIRLINIENPDIILFLGDSNSVLIAPIIRKENSTLVTPDNLLKKKFKIAHIECMRSGAPDQPEEINRKTIDAVADYFFVYHKYHKDKLVKENKNLDNIFIVGNTITEVVEPINNMLKHSPKTNDYIMLDIHRPENFISKERLKNCLALANLAGKMFNLPIKMLEFQRTISHIKYFELDLEKIELIPLMSYSEHIKMSFGAILYISDSGTSQEELCLLGTGIPCLVPRSYTERPESVENSCSLMVDVDTCDLQMWEQKILESQHLQFHTEWLRDGLLLGECTSSKIVEILKSL